MSIYNLITTSLGDLAKPNRYRVNIRRPMIFTNDFKGAAGGKNVMNTDEADLRYGSSFKIELACASVQMPGISLGTTDVRMSGGPMEKRPNDVIYEPITASFYIGQDHAERRFFADWIQLINNGRSNVFSYYNEYVTDIQIIQLDKNNVPRSGIVLREAYPVSVGAIYMAYAQIDSFMVVPVSLTYKYWEEIEMNDGLISDALTF